ncbi:four helix bundle protein [Candidatus Daviesbacteria bacterium]|nr:four helix bundle protein [Candidatus Daviesbacteria bacterium]
MIDKTSKGYHKLILWSKLKELLTLTYKLTDKLPKSEEFGLVPQMKRATVSVISNFVEGYLKSSRKDKNRFMEIAETSLMELEGQSEICLILSYWTNEDYELFDKKRSVAGYFLYRYKLSLK